jgi:GR25 family glycosyltransferase involved in LPS biosynthesis
MKMIKAFYETGEPYGIFCEDDIYLRRDIKEYLPKVIYAAKKHRLDIILLGYLLPYPPIGYDFLLKYSANGIDITGYPDHVWGALCYMLSRDQAKYFIDKYTIEYGIATNSDHPYCSDWILTKDAKRRGLVWPMLALEEGEVKTDHEGQIRFHRECTKAHYNPNVFI